MPTISEVLSSDSGVASPEATEEQESLTKSLDAKCLETSTTSNDNLQSEEQNSFDDSKPQINLDSNEADSAISKGPASDLAEPISKSDELELALASLSQVSQAKKQQDEDDDEYELIDESIAERLWGLTEMFPTSLRSMTHTLQKKSISFIKASYNLTRQIVWIGVSTSLIAMAPAMLQVELHNIEESMKQDRNRLVLGPGSSVGAPPTLPGMMPAR